MSKDDCSYYFSLGNEKRMTIFTHTEVDTDVYIFVGHFDYTQDRVNTLHLLVVGAALLGYLD